MRPTSIAFAAALMLGGMSTAYAQDAQEKARERPAQAQEQQGQSGGADRGKAETKSDRGSDNGAGRSAQKGGGDDAQKDAQGERRNRDEAGQGKSRQAQDEKSSQPQKDGERASKKGESESGKDQRETKRESSRDEDGKAADRSDSNADKEKRATQKKDESDKRDSAQTKDDADKRAATEKDKDAKRAGSEDRQDRDDSAKRADRKDGERDGKSARVELQGEKRNKVQSALRERGDVKERTNVDIDISVGRALPRDWDYYPLPPAIIEVVPEYRGYRYAYVEDRYVIIDPNTYEVVTVIEAGGSGQASTASRGRCSSDLALSSEDREYLLRSVQMRREADVSGVSIGWRVPDSVELEVFPDQVTQRISGLGSCRYFVVDDRIAIVDPDAHNVVILVQD